MRGPPSPRRMSGLVSLEGEQRGETVIGSRPLWPLDPSATATARRETAEAGMGQVKLREVMVLFKQQGNNRITDFLFSLNRIAKMEAARPLDEAGVSGRAAYRRSVERT